MDDFNKAIADYKKSTELEPNFVFSHIQLAVAQYKQGDKDGSMIAFRSIIQRFSDRVEPYNYAWVLSSVSPFVDCTDETV